MHGEYLIVGTTIKIIVKHVMNYKLCVTKVIAIIGTHAWLLN